MSLVTGLILQGIHFETSPASGKLDIVRTNWQIGDTIKSRWHIHNILKGGMGIVYIVYDDVWKCPFAVKCFLEELFASNSLVADRFVQEARLWINLDAHQNICRARMVEEIEHRPFLFLEYITGGDLSQWIGTPRLTQDLPQVLRFALQFCDGMQHAVSKGLQAHRDIKPQNCLITEDGTLKVTDFGLAKMFEEGPVIPAPASRSVDTGEGLSRTGVAFGTCTHMAPEQFEDAKRVDVRADIYAFGVMLWQMVRGRLPWLIQGASPLERWMKYEEAHKNQPPPPLNSPLPVLNEIATICLAKRPDLRFSDFAELRARLALLYEEMTGKMAPQPATGDALRAEEWATKGLSLKRLGRPMEALASLDQALELRPQLEEAMNNKGNVLLQLGRPEEAMACYNRVLETSPGDAAAWSNKGATLHQSGRYEEGLVCFDRALEFAPLNAEFWANKGLALRALGHEEDALACRERALELNPFNGEFLVHKAETLAKLNRIAEALVCFDQAIELDPRDVNAWRGKGQALLVLGRHEEALGCLDRALQIAPGIASAWSDKGVILSALGQVPEALACYDRAIEINPRLAQIWFNKGNSLMKLGRAAEGLAIYEHCLELDPTLETVWAAKGGALQALGRNDEALQTLAQRLNLNPRQPNILRQMGIASMNLERFADAIKFLNLALEVNPKASEAWISKGAVLAALNRDAESLSHFERALELEPQCVEAWRRKGHALMRLERRLEALDSFRRATELCPRDGESWQGLGIITLGLAVNRQEQTIDSVRLEKAMACFQQAHKLGYPDAAGSIALCKQLAAVPRVP